MNPAVLNSRYRFQDSPGKPSYQESVEALRYYDGLQRDGVKPSVPVVLAALKACSRWRDLKSGRRIHGDLVSSAAEFNVVVANTLLDMYCKCGRMADVKQVFDSMPARNVVSWNIVILGYAQCGEGELALKLFTRMQREDGLEPNSRTYIAALKACTGMFLTSRVDETRSYEQKFECLKLGMAIHEQAERTGLDSDTYLGSCLVDMYAKCGRMVEARKVFDKMSFHDVVSWTALISGYVQKGDGKLALELFDRMQCRPNALTFGAAVNACARLAMDDTEGEVLKYLEKGRELHSQLSRLGYEADLFVASGLVDMYSNCERIDEAREVFERMRNRDVVAWNAIILGTAQCGDGNTALELFSRMQKEGFIPNSRTYIAALNACSSLATEEEEKHVDGKLVKVVSLERGRAIHTELQQRGYASVVFVANSLMDMYAKCGSMRECRQVFDGVQRRNFVTWTVIIMGYAQNNDSETALKLYSAMKQDRDEDGTLFYPNAQTFVAVLRACGRLAALETGKTVHEEIRRCNLEKNPQVACSLIGFYGRCGETLAAQQVFDSITKKDVAVWSALMSAYGLAGETGRVFELFELMKQGNVEPDSVTFVSLLSACGHAGLVEKGKEFFEVMRRGYGVRVRVEHYSCMVDLLSRANRLEEAVEMAERMESYVVWMSILGACKKWKNVEVGEAAFRRLVELEPRECGAYAAMVNLYSSVGMWEECRRVERLQLENAVDGARREEEDRCWWSDEAGNVHKFVPGSIVANKILI